MPPLASCGRGCSNGWDVRCCCEPDCHRKNTVEMLRACPMRVSTMVFHMGNNQDWYNAATANDFSWLDEFGFTDADKREMINDYKEEQPKCLRCEARDIEQMKCDYCGEDMCRDCVKPDGLCGTCKEEVSRFPFSLFGFSLFSLF